MPKQVGVAGLWAIAGGVAGTALQLQQAALWPMAVYLSMLLLAVGLAFLGRRRAAWVAAGVLAGFALTGARAALFATDALDPALQGQDIVVVGRIASLPQLTAQGERFEWVVESARLRGQDLRLPPRLAVSWWAQAPTARRVVAGERWRFTLRLRLPHGLANPHGFDRERSLWERGIQATAYVREGSGEAAPQRLGMTWRHPVDRARQQVVERISSTVGDSRSAGVLAALVVGDQAAIERSDWDLFRTTGVAHLMSISGLHVTMFAWLATALVGGLWRRLGRHRPALLLSLPAPIAAAWGGIALAAAYALLAGWGVPAQRTLLMLAVAVGLRQSARQWPWPAVWLLVLGVVVALDPWALLQAGFWLSFLAVALLFASDARPVGESATMARRAWRSLRGLLREQLRITLALGPLSLLLFGQTSLVGLVANLLAIPWVTLLVTPLALLGVGLAPLWQVAALAVQGLNAVLEWLALWPAAVVFRPAAPWPLAAAAVLGGAVLVLRLPLHWRAAGVLLVWPALSWSPPRPPDGQFELVALDVGQGSAMLVRTARHSLLYDTGPRWGEDADAGERVVVPVLRALGEVPDTVVVSHSDSDHAGGSAAVAAAWPQAAWRSSFDIDPERRCLAGQRWRWDGVDFEVLHPTDGQIESGRLDSNALSCVLRVSAGAQSAWLAGDLDAAHEVRLALARPELRATVMLAPHHGSLTSSSPVLLNTLQPRWVLVQAGFRNRFGHPAPAVLQRYRERGMRWVGSPACGAATWRSSEPEVVHCERQVRQRYWHTAAEAL